MTEPQGPDASASHLVLVLSVSPVPERSGPALVAAALVRTAVGMGGCAALIVGPGVSPEDRIELAIRFPGVRFDFIEAGDLSRRQLAQRLWRSARFWPVSPVRFAPDDVARWLGLQLRSSQPRAVVFDSFNLAEQAPMGSGVPTILIPTDAYSLNAMRMLLHRSPAVERLKSLWKLIAYARYERRMYPRFDRVLPISPNDVGWLQSLVPDAHLDLVHPAIELPPYVERSTGAGSEPPRPVRVAVAGTAAIPPVRSDLLAAARALRPALDQHQPPIDMFLWTHGAEGPGRRFRRSATRTGVPIVAWVPDYRAFLSGLDVYVYPQQTGAGIQTKVVEAMATGAVVVARRQTLDPIGAVDGHHAVLLRDDVDMSAQLDELLSNAPLRSRIGRSASNHVHSLFDGSVFSGELQGILADIAQARTTSALDVAVDPHPART